MRRVMNQKEMVHIKYLQKTKKNLAQKMFYPRKVNFIAA